MKLVLVAGLVVFRLAEWHFLHHSSHFFICGGLLTFSIKKNLTYAEWTVFYILPANQ